MANMKWARFTDDPAKRSPRENEATNNTKLLILPLMFKSKCRIAISCTQKNECFSVTQTFSAPFQLVDAIELKGKACGTSTIFIMEGMGGVTNDDFNFNLNNKANV